jgi:hypothetical protein
MPTSASVRNVIASVENHTLITRGKDPIDGENIRIPERIHASTRTKLGPWEPTSTSLDTENTSCLSKQRLPSSTHHGNSTEETKEETVSSTDESPTSPARPVPFPQQSTLERLFESASQAVDSVVKSASAQSKRVGSLYFVSKQEESPPKNSTPTRSNDMMSILIDECSPCTPTYFDSLKRPPRRSSDSIRRDISLDPSLDPIVDQLGISPMVSPHQDKTEVIPTIQNVTSTESVSTPASRRRQRYVEKQARMSQTNLPIGPKLASSLVPMQSLMVNNDQSLELERSISELTMKSSYGEATSRLAENRRMAYYAVGKHHKNSGRGGNRRCYFTGKLILGGAPFYAGSVQQGLRTLVVFCLPSAIGLPKGVDLRRQNSSTTDGDNGLSGPSGDSVVTRESSYGVAAMPRILKPESLLKRSRSRSVGATSTVGSASRLSSLDDMSLSLEEDLDPNWGLDRDYLLTVLPEPSQDLLEEMSARYPDQFDTLPIQVRSPHCWRLFIKFCFFSGLPIAEGELHYKVKDDISNDTYGEEIILSHEVMEAVNGETAEIIRLPNLKTFRYLRKHYTQQSGKLSDVVFKRTSWEMVFPEI